MEATHNRTLPRPASTNDLYLQAILHALENVDTRLSELVAIAEAHSGRIELRLTPNEAPETAAPETAAPTSDEEVPAAPDEPEPPPTAASPKRGRAKR